MIKVEVIDNFTLEKYDELKNIERHSNSSGNYFKVRDIFECTEEMAKYLTGNNDQKKVVVKVLEVIPNEENVIPLQTEKLEEVAKAIQEALPTTEEIDKAYEEITNSKKKNKSKK